MAFKALECCAKSNDVKTQKHAGAQIRHYHSRMCSYVLFLQVRYECLSDEIKIGDYYLRLLLEEDENEESSAIKRS